MKNIIIYKVKVGLTQKGWWYRVLSQEFQEKQNSYESEGRRISKNKLLKIDSVYNERHNLLSYFTYCKEGDQNFALSKLKKHISEKALQYKNEIDILISYIDKK